jgi:hypothetical protein
MPKLNAGITRGHGDSVLVVPPVLSHDPAFYTFTHNGRSNFIVEADDDGLSHVDTLINNIGPYSGRMTIPDGTKVINIAADGDWTIKRNN